MRQGMIFEIKRFAVHDGPGIRTTVFFKGCPLKCIWCHNPEGICPKPELALLKRKCAHCGECFASCPSGLHTRGEDGEHHIDRERCILCLSCARACMPGALKPYGARYTAQTLLEAVCADEEFFTQSGGGVTCSGGEPLMQPDFLADFLYLCKRAGLHTAVDTSGCAGWADFEKILPVTDIFLYDIKHMDPHEHRRLTGADNRIILENLEWVFARGAGVEIRMPILPGLNDDGENLARTADFLLQGIGSITLVRPLPYHALSASKYAAIGKSCADMPPATGGEYAAARRVAAYFEQRGLRVRYPE